DTFSSEIVIDDFVDAPYSVKSADLNNDGYIDIVLGLYVDKSAILYLNNGDGTFAEPVTIVGNFSYGVEKVYLSDIDNDGLLDVFCVTSSYNSLYFAKNLGNGNFQEKIHITDIDNYNS